MHDQSEDYSLSHAYRILGHELVFSRNLPQYQFSVYYNQHNDLASEFYSSRNWCEWYNNGSSDYVIDHEYEHKSTMLTTSGMNAIAYGVYSNILALILLLFNLKHSAKLACKRTPISWTTYIKKEVNDNNFENLSKRLNDDNEWKATLISRTILFIYLIIKYSEMDVFF